MVQDLVIKTSFGQVACAIYGDQSLRDPAFYFHGFPGSRVEAKICHIPGKESGLSLLALDRPGFGGSDYQANRKLTDWPPLVAEVAKYFGLTRFSVCGVSAGAAYALATSACLPKSVEFCLILSGISEIHSSRALEQMSLFNRVLLGLMKRAPAVGEAIVSTIARWYQFRPQDLIVFLRNVLGQSDRLVLKELRNRTLLIDNLVEALRQGPRGLAHDFNVISSKWNIPLSKILAPTVLLHGTNDWCVPELMSVENNQHIIHAQLVRIAGAGHLMALEMSKTICATLRARRYKECLEESYPQAANW